MGRTGTYIALAIMVLVGVFGGAISWAGSGNAPSFIETGYDRLVLRVTGSDPFTRCYERQRWAAEVYYFPVIIEAETPDCYHRPERLSGILIDEFEGLIFLKDARSAEHYVIPCQSVWWSLSPWREVNSPVNFPSRDEMSRVWKVDFIGRKSPYWNFQDRPLAYGHLGMSEHAVIIDRFISVDLVSEYVGYSGQPAGNPVRWETNCDNPH